MNEVIVNMIMMLLNLNCMFKKDKIAILTECLTKVNKQKEDV